MANTTTLAAEVTDLVWAFIDERASRSQVRRLEELLLGSPQARRLYVTCMQMHADLCCLLGKKRSPLPTRVAGRRKPDAPRRRTVSGRVPVYVPTASAAMEAPAMASQF
jgi:hypothetical protein